jgi:hypothetical protein
MALLCESPPVVPNVLAIDPYATPAVVEYLQVAFSFVVTRIVVEVVPAASVPVGAPPERTGAVESAVPTVKTTSRK